MTMKEQVLLETVPSVCTQRIVKQLFAVCVIFCLSSDPGWFAVAGDGFTDHPQNQTARIGHFIDFQCQTSGHRHTLKFLVNGRGLKHLDVDSRYFDTNLTLEVARTSTLARFWIIANEITLEAIKYVNCNLTVVNSSGVFDISSDKAFIVDVVYPDVCPSVSACRAVQVNESNECNLATDYSGYHRSTLSWKLLSLSLSLSCAVCVFLNSLHSLHC